MAAIDHRGFPHILEAVIGFADYGALSALARTSRRYRGIVARLDHVVITPLTAAGTDTLAFSVACTGREHPPMVFDGFDGSSSLAIEFLRRAAVIDVDGTLPPAAVAALVRATPHAHTLRILSGQWTHRPAHWGVRTLVSLSDYNITDAYADIDTVVVGMRLHHRYMPAQLWDRAESRQEVHFIFPQRDTFGHDLAKPVPSSAAPRDVAFTRSSIYRVLAYAHMSLLRGQKHYLVGITEYHPDWYDMNRGAFSVQLLETRLADYAYNLLCGPGGSGYNGDACERQIADSILFPTFDEYCKTHPGTVACLGEWTR